jgi:hypothetical protein
MSYPGHTDNQAIRLSPTELLGCWNTLNLGEPPSQLWIRPPGRTVEESTALLTRAVGGLADRGLSNGLRPHPTLANALRVIADAELILNIRFHDQRGTAPTLLGLGATTGAHGITLITYDSVNGLTAPLRLHAMDSTRVAAALLGLTATHGPIRPGVGAPVNIPAEEFDTALRRAPHGDLWAMTDRLRELGIPSRDATSLARMCSGIQATGQLGATGRHGQFRREQHGRWRVGFHSTERGWFLQLRRDGMVTVYPTDGARLIRQWHELIETVRRIR